MKDVTLIPRLQKAIQETEALIAGLTDSKDDQRRLPLLTEDLDRLREECRGHIPPSSQAYLHRKTVRK